MRKDMKTFIIGPQMLWLWLWPDLDSNLTASDPSINLDLFKVHFHSLESIHPAEVLQSKTLPALRLLVQACWQKKGIIVCKTLLKSFKCIVQHHY